MLAILNNGQACIAGSRLFVPENRLDEVKQLVKAAVAEVKVGDPNDSDVTIGPLASQKQYQRVQSYIRSGIDEGAEVVVGGEGHPQGLERGNFVKPTVFANVKPEHEDCTRRDLRSGSFDPDLQDRGRRHPNGE